jgi:diguanylate cyclase (GGDEF)-like protein
LGCGFERPCDRSEGGVHRERGIKPPKLRAFSFNRRWSIGARLGAAFAAVAGLAVAANLLIEQQISSTHTTRVVRIVVPASTSPAENATAASLKAASSKSLIAAIEHYEAAVRGRSDINDEDSGRRLASAARELDGETPDQLQARLAEYRSRGSELAHAADVRKKTFNQLEQRFDAMDARTKASLAESWKIFGRVVARKSLVDLNSSLDEIRRAFANLPAAGLYDRDVLGAITASEKGLAASLKTNQAALTRSQGEAWVMQMYDDMAQIGRLQDAVVVLDVQRRAAEENFSRETRSLVALAGAAAPEAARQSNARQSLVSVLPGGDSHAAIGAVQEPLGEHATETSSITVGQSAGAAVIFWLSAGVLLLLLWISIRTVMSVVGPVRRLRAVTLKIAGGDADGVQVRRGGIRELDDLALSFNTMAAQLADAQTVARNHRQHLEAEVSLRTRELQHLAEHDPLTNLPNRRQLFLHLNAVISRAKAGGSRVGVFFVDLDNFKNINESMGHAFGDRVLCAIAERLRIRSDPAGFAARLGGDEFTVVCDSVMNAEELDSIGQDLVLAFQQPLDIDGRHLMTSISVGASLYPEHGDDAQTLLSAADAALFRAKALGRSQLNVFSPALLEAATAKFNTEQGLRYALERGELELVFQPEVNASTLSTHLVEALLRWRMPDGRRESPSEFLAIAEESGLIMEISDWVLKTAVETASRWHHGAWPEARVAVNLSSRQLLDARFVERMMGLLRDHRLPAHCIEIELTENVLQTGAATIEVLHQLRRHGVAIALDDFGIGYSSLASLEQLPLTRVKLDRALIAGIHTSARSAAIARALAGLCQNIGLEVTAEGIESPEQLAWLMDLAPINLQGYLLARPVSAEDLLPLLAALPNHMASLLLSTVVTDAKDRPPADGPPAIESTARKLRASQM